MADASADAPPAMSDAQAETLRVVVGNLRRCLPDPSARDVHDAIAKHDGAMAAWATAGRVKKLCTKMNKELKGRGSSRVGDEPDETDGPVLVEALPSWPSTTRCSVFLHLAARGDSRVFFPHEHHERVAGEDVARVSVGAEFRRSLAEAARLFDARVKMWRLITHVDVSKDSKDSKDSTHTELVVVCKAAKVLEKRRNENGASPSERDDASTTTSRARCVFEVAFTIGDATKNAHKRLLEKPLAENAGAIGEIRLSNAARDVWLAHLKRNRHYEDKYGKESGKESSSGEEWRREWWDENVQKAARATRDAAPRARTQTWETSYVVTPNPEWFR